MSKYNAPWETKPTASLGPQYGVYDDNGRDVAIVYDHDDMTKAKAQLIAAAPDLLAACRAFLFQVIQGPVIERDAVVTQARAAIAKAEGETR